MIDVPCAEVIEKIRRGDAIDDAELRQALRFYCDMEAGLKALGPHFHLAWVEVSRTSQLLDSFWRARLEKR